MIPQSTFNSLFNCVKQFDYPQLEENPKTLDTLNTEVSTLSKKINKSKAHIAKLTFSASHCSAGKSGRRKYCNLQTQITAHTENLHSDEKRLKNLKNEIDNIINPKLIRVDISKHLGHMRTVTNSHQNSLAQSFNNIATPIFNSNFHNK
jgi:predicted RNase H-like nuclease (RuvC/YqgF family)